MKLIAVSTFTFSLVLAACGGSKAPAVATEPTVSAIPPGHYGCRITQGGWAYSYYACDVRNEGGAIVIEKIEGQMLFKGTLTPEGDGSLGFDGEIWCNWDEGCKGAVVGNLQEIDGGWEGTLPPYPMASGETMPPMSISLLRESVLESAGGTRYGAYGQAGWNGGGYTGEVTGE